MVGSHDASRIVVGVLNLAVLISLRACFRREAVQVHDLYATILHLLGFDHTQLAYRLMDIHGLVVGNYSLSC
jgi:Protein of unknown function (DUF1501)